MHFATSTPRERTIALADQKSIRSRFLGPWTVIAVLFLIAAIILIVVETVFKATSFKDALTGPLRAVVILVIGSLIVKIVESMVLSKSLTALTPRQRTIAGFAIRLALYLGILLAVLAGIGIGLSSFVFGGAFLTVVLGLAGQSVLTNILGGIWLVMFQPFQVSDSISFMTWQYAMMPPSYAHEALKPTYSGRVTDINIMYTTIVTDEGDPMVLPNGIMAQAAIINRSRSGARKCGVRFDVPTSIDPRELTTNLLKDLGSWDRPPILEMTDVTIDSYTVRVSVWSRETDERIRDRILQSAWRVISALGTKPAETTVVETDE